MYKRQETYKHKSSVNQCYIIWTQTPTFSLASVAAKAALMIIRAAEAKNSFMVDVLCLDIV